MDMSLVMAALSAQTGAMQQQVATAALKSNLDTQKSTVLTLLGADQQAPRSPTSPPVSAAMSTSPLDRAV
jgi:hypothetical protein